jgi:hypothetical protein
MRNSYSFTCLGRKICYLFYILYLIPGVDYRGVLACLDGYMNIALEQTEVMAISVRTVTNVFLPCTLKEIGGGGGPTPYPPPPPTPNRYWVQIFYFIWSNLANSTFFACESETLQQKCFNQPPI